MATTLVIHARMKSEKHHKKECECEECNGTGHVTCPECDGLGYIETDEELSEQELADDQGYEWQRFWLHKRYKTDRPKSIRDYWLA